MAVLLLRPWAPAPDAESQHGAVVQTRARAQEPAARPWEPPLAQAAHRQPPATQAAATAGAARPAAAGATAVPITASAVRTLAVGQTGELVVGLGAAAGVGEVAFTVQFDADILQARAAAEGDWAAVAGAQARFEADISSAENRVQVRSAVAGPRLGGGGGSVATVQFQAVAPGTTWVMISDVTVKDRTGNTMPFALLPSSLQVTAESLPQQQAPRP